MGRAALAPTRPGPRNGTWGARDRIGALVGKGIGAQDLKGDTMRRLHGTLRKDDLAIRTTLDVFEDATRDPRNGTCEVEVPEDVALYLEVSPDCVFQPNEGRAFELICLNAELHEGVGRLSLQTFGWFPAAMMTNSSSAPARR